MRKLPSISLLHHGRYLALIGLLAASSCAKFPDGTADAGSTRLLFRMRINGEIRSDYVYIFAIRASNDLNPTTQGPIPVIEYPNANGFVAGNATHFIRWDPLQSGPYLVYKFTKSDLTEYIATGFPISEIDVVTGGRTIGFDISLNQLADTADAAKLLQSLQVNFLTMNRVSQNTGSGRVIDALGDTRLPSEINDYVRIPLNTSRKYDNQSFGELEPPSDGPTTTDCPDPSLDIVDFSIEVRR